MERRNRDRIEVCPTGRIRKAGWLRHYLLNAAVAWCSVARSVFGHAKRNCASEAYEPPLKFGMIASSKAATSSNSSQLVFSDGLSRCGFEVIRFRIGFIL